MKVEININYEIRPDGSSNVNLKASLDAKILNVIQALEFGKKNITSMLVEKKPEWENLDSDELNEKLRTTKLEELL